MLQPQEDQMKAIVRGHVVGFVQPEEKLRDMFVSPSDAGSRPCCDSEVYCSVSAVFGRVSVSGVCFSASSVRDFTSSNKDGYGSYALAVTCQEWLSLPPSLCQL